MKKTVPYEMYLAEKTAREAEKAAYEAIISELRAKVEELVIKVAELEAKINLNSKNSNKPPSSDGYSKSSPQNSRIKTGKKTGGQEGHEGKTLQLKEHPEEVAELKPDEQVCTCGGNVLTEETQYVRHQVIDIKKPTVTTTEYRQYEGICNMCGKIYRKEFPAEAANTIQYGSVIKATLTYLNVYQLIPLKRATELISDFYGLSISQGTIVNTNQEMSEQLEAYTKEVKAAIINSEVVHFDETGMRNNGRLEWLHTASTVDMTYYFAHEKRGKKAIDAMGILPKFTGIAVHDHWKPYYQYELCAHSECNAHILRYLIHLYEDLKYVWATEMIALLLKIKRHVELLQIFESGIETMPKDEVKIYEESYNRILESATLEEVNRPKRYNKAGKLQKSEAVLLSERLQNYMIETLTFMYDFRVPFDNNQAERDIRMPKAKQKISGGFRSHEGSQTFAVIRGFISTCKKRGVEVMKGLTQAFCGNATTFLNI